MTFERRLSLILESVPAFKRSISDTPKAPETAFAGGKVGKWGARKFDPGYRQPTNDELIAAGEEAPLGIETAIDFIRQIISNDRLRRNEKVQEWIEDLVDYVEWMRSEIKAKAV